MAEQVYTLLIPVALLYTNNWQLQAIRIVRCKVVCKEGGCLRNRVTPAKAKGAFFQSQLYTLQIDAIKQTEVIEISLTNFSEHKRLRAFVYGNDGVRGSIYGVSTITCVVDGKAVNPNVYHPLVSHIGDKTVCIHGFFDYTGTWHEGIMDIPAREPFITELNALKTMCIKNASFTLAMIQNQMISKETILAGLALVQVGNVPSMVLSVMNAPDTAAVAATALVDSGVVEDIHLEHTGRKAYRPKVFTPVMIIPYGVQNVMFSVGQSVKEIPLKSVMLSQDLNELDLFLPVSPAIIGIAQHTLTNYVLHYAKLTTFEMPLRICGTLYNKDAAVIVESQYAEYISQCLNLSERTTDLNRLNIMLGGQAWDTIIAPVPRSALYITSKVERPEFKLCLTPPRVSITNKAKATSSASFGMIFDGDMTNNKLATLDLRAMTEWKYVNVTTQVLLDGDKPKQVDGRKQLVKVLLGTLTQKALADVKKPAYFGLSTDRTVSEEIFAPNIPYLSYTLRKPRLTKSIDTNTAGRTVIHGNIDTLIIVIESQAGETPIKDIYIDGTVGSISICVAGYKGSPAEDLRRIRVRVKNRSSVNISDSTSQYYGRYFCRGADIPMLKEGSIAKGKVPTTVGKNGMLVPLLTQENLMQALIVDY